MDDEELKSSKLLGLISPEVHALESQLNENVEFEEEIIPAINEWLAVLDEREFDQEAVDVLMQLIQAVYLRGYLRGKSQL